jgi:hypothetical protein
MQGTTNGATVDAVVGAVVGAMENSERARRRACNRGGMVYVTAATAAAMRSVCGCS